MTLTVDADAATTQIPARSFFARIVGPLIAVLMTGVFPGVVAFSAQPEAGSLWWACWIIAAYAGLRLSYLVATGKQRLFSFAFFLYVYMFLGLAPMAQLLHDEFPSVTPWVEAESIPSAFFIIAAGLMAFELGAIATGRLGRQRLGSRSLSLGRTSLFALLAIVVGLVYIFWSGPAVFLQTRSDVFALQAEVFEDSAIRNLLSSASLGMLLVACVACVSAFRLSGRKYFMVYALVAGVMLLFTSNIFNSPRYVALVVLISMLSVMGIFATEGRTRIAFVSALGGFAFVFPLLANLRTSSEFGASSSFVKSLLSGDYDSFAEIVNAVTVVANTGLLGGQQLSGALLTWVPRSVWPEKPVSTSIVIAEGMGYSFTNVSSPLWAEFYVDFGVVGVVIGFVFFGAVLQKADNRLVFSYARNLFPGLVGFIVPFYLLILVRGSLMSSFPVLVTVLVCAALLVRREAPAITEPIQFWRHRQSF